MRQKLRFKETSSSAHLYTNPSFKDCTQIGNTSLMTCRTFPTCSHHNNQSRHDKLPGSGRGSSRRQRDISESSKFSRESVLAVLCVHLRIVGPQRRSCSLLKASLYAQSITNMRVISFRSGC